MAALLERAVGAYVKQREKAKFAIVDRPRKPGATDTQTIPAATLRQAYERSGGHCEYVAADGTRCTCRVFLEADHVVMRALGGGHDRIRSCVETTISSPRRLRSGSTSWTALGEALRLRARSKPRCAGSGSPRRTRARPHAPRSIPSGPRPSSRRC
jgi:hypothetical protein